MFEVLEYMLASEQTNEEALKIFSSEQLECIQEALKHAKQLIDLYKIKKKSGKVGKKKKAEFSKKEAASLKVINELDKEANSPLAVISQLIHVGVKLAAELDVTDVVTSIIVLLSENTHNNLELFNNIYRSLPLLEKEKRELSAAEIFVGLALEAQPLSTILTSSGQIRIEENKPVATYLQSYSIDYLASKISMDGKPYSHSLQFFKPNESESNEAQPLEIDIEKLKNIKTQLYILDQTFLLVYAFYNKHKTKEILNIYHLQFSEDQAKLKGFLLVWDKILRLRPDEYPVKAEEVKNFFQDVIAECDDSLISQIEEEKPRLKF